MFSPPEPPNNMIFLFCCLLMTQRGTVLSRVLLQTAPGVFLFDPARQEGLSGDNSGEGIGLCLLEFSKFSCSKALCLIEDGASVAQRRKCSHHCPFLSILRLNACLLEFNKFSCSKALCLMERWGFSCPTPMNLFLEA